LFKESLNFLFKPALFIILIQRNFKKLFFWTFF